MTWGERLYAVKARRLPHKAPASSCCQPHISRPPSHLPHHSAAPVCAPVFRFTEAYHAQEHLEAQPPAAKRAVRAQVSDCSSDELH